jgi:hypothetical protein
MPGNNGFFKPFSLYWLPFAGGLVTSRRFAV